MINQIVTWSIINLGEAHLVYIINNNVRSTETISERTLLHLQTIWVYQRVAFYSG